MVGALAAAAAIMQWAFTIFSTLMLCCVRKMVRDCSQSRSRVNWIEAGMTQSHRPSPGRSANQWKNSIESVRQQDKLMIFRGKRRMEQTECASSLPIIIIALRFECALCVCAVKSNNAFMNSLELGRSLMRVHHTHAIIRAECGRRSLRSKIRFQEPTAHHD